MIATVILPYEGTDLAGVMALQLLAIFAMLALFVTVFALKWFGRGVGWLAWYYHLDSRYRLLRRAVLRYTSGLGVALGIASAYLVLIDGGCDWWWCCIGIICLW